MLSLTFMQVRVPSYPCRDRGYVSTTLMSTQNSRGSHCKHRAGGLLCAFHGGESWAVRIDPNGGEIYRVGAIWQLWSLRSIAAMLTAATSEQNQLATHPQLSCHSSTIDSDSTAY